MAVKFRVSANGYTTISGGASIGEDATIKGCAIISGGASIYDYLRAPHLYCYSTQNLVEISTTFLNLQSTNIYSGDLQALHFSDPIQFEFGQPLSFTNTNNCQVEKVGVVIGGYNLCNNIDDVGYLGIRAKRHKDKPYSCGITFLYEQPQSSTQLNKASIKYDGASVTIQGITSTDLKVVGNIYEDNVRVYSPNNPPPKLNNTVTGSLSGTTLTLTINE